MRGETACASNFCLAIASTDGMIADKAPDRDAIIVNDYHRIVRIVISQHQRRTRKLPLDGDHYKRRHLIENFFCQLKEFNGRGHWGRSLEQRCLRPIARLRDAPGAH